MRFATVTMTGVAVLVLAGALFPSRQARGQVTLGQNGPGVGTPGSMMPASTPNADPGTG